MRIFRVGTGMFLLAIAPLSLTQTSESRYDPAPSPGALKAKDGFVGSTLKRINPADTDYGKCLDEDRAILLQETIRNGYFWSNVVSLGLLGCLFTIIAYQHQVQANRETSTAEILVQHENARQRLTAQFDEMAKKNHGLREALTGLRGSVLRAELPATESGERVTSTVRPRATRTQVAAPPPASTSVAKSATERATRSAIATESMPQMPLFKSDTDLVMKVNALEQQLVRSEEQQKVLRHQLNESGRRLQAEQEKNRHLKGE